MHWRVLPSPCAMPIPNFASAPSSAISSVGICPVLRNATDSGPCCAWIALKRSTMVRSASSQPNGRWTPAASRRSGVVARSPAPSTASASHPLGQATPRFTG